MTNAPEKFAKALTRVTLYIEAFFNSFWLLILGLAAILGLIWLLPAGLVPSTGWLVLTLLFIIFALVYGAMGFQRPTRMDVERRLTRVNRYDFNPFDVLSDIPVHHDENHQHKWDKHQAHAQAMTHRMRPALFPRPDWRGLPRPLTFGVFILFVIGALHQGQNAPAQIQSAYQLPDRESVTEYVGYKFWLTPPSYMDQAAIPIESDQDHRFPEGTRFEGTIKSGFFMPKLVIGNQVVSFEEQPDGSFTVSAPLDQTVTRATVMQGPFVTYSQDLQIHVDEPPVVSIVEGPEITERNTIRLRAVGKDDLGLDEITFVIQIDPAIKDQMDRTEDFGLPMPLNGAELADQTQDIDMTDHPWAGFPVHISAELTDIKGQTTLGKTFRLVLPERVFEHPLARQLAEMRKTLFLENTREEMTEHAMKLFSLSQGLESYDGKIDIYMGMIHGAYRLLNSSDNAAELRTVRGLLWDLAVAIDGGSSRIAADNLQRALSAAAQALQNPNLTEEDFQAVQQQLEQAVNEYFQSLMREMDAMMRERGMDGIPPEMEEMMQPDMDAGSMMQELMETLQNGTREEIADALRQLDEMVEQLKNTNFQPMTKEMMQAMADAGALKEIIERQELLLGETIDLRPKPALNPENPFERFLQENRLYDSFELPSGNLQSPGTQGNDAPAAPEVVISPLAIPQNNIRRDLDKIYQSLSAFMPDKTEFINEAMDEMRQAEDTMEANDIVSAIGHQERAIEILNQGAEQAMQQLMQSMGPVISFRLQPSGSRSGGKRQGPRDPFGRAASEGEGQTGGVELSDEEKRRRIQDIRDQIIERSDGVQDAPLAEDYFERLLERF